MAPYLELFGIHYSTCVPILVLLCKFEQLVCYAAVLEESNPETSACSNIINKTIVSNLPIPISVSNPTESVLSYKDVPNVDCSHIQQSQEEEKLFQSLPNKAINETNKDTEETMEDSLNPPMESDTHDSSTMAMSRTSFESPLLHSEESSDVNLIYKGPKKIVSLKPSNHVMLTMKLRHQSIPHVRNLMVKVKMSPLRF